MPLNTSNTPLPDRPLGPVEQATAAPGELRNVEIPDERRCHVTMASGKRCERELGHDGPHWVWREVEDVGE